MNIYSDSKTDLKLRCDYCIKFQLLEGAQDVFSRLMVVCCMLLPHNTYRVPQHYTRHVCGPSCSCKHRFFVGISGFLALVLFELYGYSMPLTISLATKKCSLHRPLLIFESKVNSSASYKQISLCQTLLVSWDRIRSYYVWTWT
jgi:hypothetical protein